MFRHNSSSVPMNWNPGLPAVTGLMLPYTSKPIASKTGTFMLPHSRPARNIHTNYGIIGQRRAKFREVAYRGGNSRDVTRTAWGGRDI